MIAIKITNQKEFMTRLLTTELFDSFFVEEASIDTFNSFHIDGRIHRNFYKNDPDYLDDTSISEFSLWKDLRPVCFNLIKGKRTPLGFKFVFYLGDEAKDMLVNDKDSGLKPSQLSLGLNIRFSNGELLLTTGMACSVFTLDKTIEKAWDDYIPRFLEQNGISNDLYV